MSENGGVLATPETQQQLRENADLLEKAIEFMSDDDQILEAEADINLWRKAADRLDVLERALEVQNVHR